MNEVDLNTGYVRRRRRVVSNSEFQDINAENEKIQRERPDKPVHTPCDSLFSWNSGFSDFAGVMNWAFLIITIGGLLLTLENYHRYGLLIDSNFYSKMVFSQFCGAKAGYTALYLILYTHIALLIALTNEKFIAFTNLEGIGTGIHIVNITGLLVIPVVVINTYFQYIGPACRLYIILTNMITSFKLVSYAHVNHWLRENYETPVDGINLGTSTKKINNEKSPSKVKAVASLLLKNLVILDSSCESLDESGCCGGSSSDNSLNSGTINRSVVLKNSFMSRRKRTISNGDYGNELSSSDSSSTLSSNNSSVMTSNYSMSLTQYPQNLTLKDIYYFWIAPTLCYELNFPRMGRRRKFFLIRRLLEVVILVNVALMLIQQWMIPSVVNSLIPFTEMKIVEASVRLLKLALPTHFIWLLWFYMTFHSTLNTVGEIMCFSDRKFYSDWWNATNLVEFWKQWNIPVHRWCARHLYKPLLRCGWSRKCATTAVFLFSAILHEYFISVPLGVFKAYAFGGMVLQVPLISISKFLETRIHPRAGNIIVWLSLVIGQPMAIMMYYHDYVIQHHGPQLIHIFGTM